MEFTRSEISAYYNTRVPAMPQPDARQWRGRCPVHDGKDLNFSVDPETGMATCHSQCGKGWDIIGLEMEIQSCDFVKAKADVFRLIGRQQESWQDRDIEATYDYCDEMGQLVYQVVRKHGKKFMQRRPAANGKWTWGLGKVTPLPYQLAKVLSAKDMVVGICEGEKDVSTLIRAGWTATCNNGGAGNFKPEIAQWFKDRHVAIFPDNDEPGRRHAEGVAQILFPVAASVRIVEIPGLPLKGDVSDYLNSGKTGAELYDLYAESQDWTPEWKFTSDVPHPNDRYLRTFGQYVAEVGGDAAFWKSIEIEGLSTPFWNLTRDLTGLRKGEVYVIAANQGSGKTSLALQFASTVLEARQGVLIFSMEMAHREIFQRIAAIDARVDLNLFRKLRKYGEDPIGLVEIENRLAVSTAKFNKSPLYVSTKGGVTIEYLVEEAQRVKARAKIAMVVVDHMQLMGSTGNVRSDYEKFTAISRATKEIASELDVPLLLVSQTSRANSTDKRWELEVSDIRGSGAIEEDAAAVMLLYHDRDDYKNAKLEPNEERVKKGPIQSWLKLGKNRYGPQGIRFALNHFKSCTRFDLLEAEK